MRNTDKYSADLIYDPVVVTGWAISELNVSQNEVVENYTQILKAYEKWLIAKDSAEELNDSNALRRVKKNQFTPYTIEVELSYPEVVGKFYGLLFKAENYNENTDLYEWSVILKWGFINQNLWSFTTSDYKLGETEKHNRLEEIMKDLGTYIDSFDRDLKSLKQFEFINHKKADEVYSLIEI